MQSDTDYDYKYAVLCNACTRIYVIEVPAADYNGDAVDCPRCGQTTVEIQEADRSRYRTCVEAACSQYLSSAANIDRQDRCEGKRTDKKGPCNAEVEVLSLLFGDVFRAFNPWPVAEGVLDQGGRLRVWDAVVVQATASGARPGAIVAATRAGIDVATGDGVLRLTKVQPPSARVMDAAAYLAAHSLTGVAFVA